MAEPEFLELQKIRRRQLERAVRTAQKPIVGCEVDKIGCAAGAGQMADRARRPRLCGWLFDVEHRPLDRVP
jgi:hypothetical protein